MEESLAKNGEGIKGDEASIEVGQDRALSAANEAPGTWSVLANRVFRSLWLANVASGIGSAMHERVRSGSCPVSQAQQR
jgi:hypothetical protein